MRRSSSTDSRIRSVPPPRPWPRLTADSSAKRCRSRRGDHAWRIRRLRTCASAWSRCSSRRTRLPAVIDRRPRRAGSSCWPGAGVDPRHRRGVTPASTVSLRPTAPIDQRRRAARAHGRGGGRLRAPSAATSRPGRRSASGFHDGVSRVLLVVGERPFDVEVTHRASASGRVRRWLLLPRSAAESAQNSTESRRLRHGAPGSSSGRSPPRGSSA